MLISETTVTIQAGQGGAGKVAFFANKNGPSGGNGGRGGDVYAVVNHNTYDLRKYVEKNIFKADNGKGGFINRQHGENATDLELQMPPGTTIIDTATGEENELTADNPRILLCRGGIGGRGNDAFKTAVHRTPRKSEPGRIGEKKEFKLILKLIADCGFIGLPNVGKSTLLNLLTAADVKTANYPFTTLEPNLGVYNKIVLADIPGLIEGASAGRGLGIKFLKHIEKVKLLLHCIPADSADVVKDYETVRTELGQYSKILLDKKEIIILTKTDMSTPDEVERKRKLLEQFHKKVITISVFDDSGIDALKTILA